MQEFIAFRSRSQEDASLSLKHPSGSNVHELLHQSQPPTPNPTLYTPSFAAPPINHELIIVPSQSSRNCKRSDLTQPGNTTSPHTHVTPETDPTHYLSPAASISHPFLAVSSCVLSRASQCRGEIRDEDVRSLGCSCAREL